MSKAMKYEKKTPREHVLARPDTYIGDVEKTKEFMWIYNQEGNKIIEKEIIYTPGFLKIFDEILVNARDASVSDKGCDTIKVEFNKEENYISIYNNGDIPIPVEEHPKHKVLVPSMIFGEMLTSSNYDDSQKRTTGGRNGYGAKLTNIFSKEFYLEIGDTERKKKFKQTWKENMSISEKAKVTKYSKKENYVYVKFYPDLEKFGLTELDDYHYQLFYRRTLDIVGTSPKSMKIYFNNKKLNINNFKKYSELYYPDEKLLFDESNKRWTVGCIHIPDSDQKVISFVNGISTHRGGTHVNHVVDKVVKELVVEIKKKEKDIKISPTLIKDNLIFFINSVIENPAFSSQTKDTLTTKSNKFGSAYKIDDKFIKKISKSGIVNQVVLLAKFKESSKLKKTDGKKQIKIKGIPKLEDANKAGSKQSNKCSLILTEGDSAKSFAMSGLSIVGRDYYGVFPLKGKLLNVREASVKQRLNNEEINNLKRIMGLRLDTQYNDEEDYNTLRYGRIVILTDQDTDGSHIKGLLINFFHYLWPSLIKRKGFITSLSTPIVKAFKGKKEKIFYNLTEYEKWGSKEHKGWKIKYYKGLGTSTSKEAKEYFVDLEDKLINYFCQEAIEGSNKKLNINDDTITLAFDKKRSDDRKIWLMNYDKENILKYEQREITYPEFINSDLIHFSNDDTSRSIPSLLDGLKPSQRKILYGAYLRKLDKEEVKVAQLAGFVSDKAAYHHGEASLMGAIIGMAQDFVGSNNINILKPNGQFGTILLQGKDSASPRYIWTQLEDLTPLIFRKSDNPILKQQDDDGLPIEPETYAPIIPMVLINGCEGIGTGFSTKIPPYNPLDVINNLYRLLDGKKVKTLKPFWQGFRGNVKKIDKNHFELCGVYNKSMDNVIITSLPVGVSTFKYKEFLEKKLEVEGNKKDRKTVNFVSYADNNTDKRVHFELKFNKGKLSKITNFEKTFNLVKKYSTTNMHLYSVNGSIKKYKDIKEIINEYYDERLQLYQARRLYQLNVLKNELDMICYKVKFILMIINKELKVNNKKKVIIEGKLEKHKFPRLGINKDFQYLLGMPIYSLTYEKVEELKKQENEKKSEYNKLEKLTPKDIWRSELDELLKAYNKWIDAKKDDEIVKTKKGKKKLKF